MEIPGNHGNRAQLRGLPGTHGTARGPAGFPLESAPNASLPDLLRGAHTSPIKEIPALLPYQSYEEGANLRFPLKVLRGKSRNDVESLDFSEDSTRKRRLPGNNS